MNQFSMAGTVKETLTDKVGPHNITKHYIVVESKRNFREPSGELKTDIYEIEVWKGIYETIKHTCTIDTKIAIKGRIINNDSVLHLIAEAINII